MLDLNRIIDTINHIAPEALQEPWDNSGIQINCGEDKNISKIMTCLEISRDIIDEAVKESVDMIVTHHPLIFSKLSKIDTEDITGEHIIKLIKNGIAVYSAHTSFDSALKGTNYYLANKLSLKNLSPLIPSSDFQECGMGRYGEYDHVLSFQEFLNLLKEACPDSDIRIAGKKPEFVKKVSVCTGAGAEFIDTAFSAGSDVFVTGDLKYHEAMHTADIGFCVIDAGHYGTEVIFAENMEAQLKSKLGDDVYVFSSKTDINPFLR